MNDTSQLISWIELILGSILVPILITLLTNKFMIEPEKQSTQKKLFEKFYYPIFKLVELDLYNKNITIEKVIEYCDEIEIIIENSKGYYNPETKDHIRILRARNEYDYVDWWIIFSDSFSITYDKTSKNIGIPIRGRDYKVNNRQYSSIPKLVWHMILVTWPTILFFIFLLLIFIYLKSN